MEKFVDFMSGGIGRALRFVVGAAAIIAALGMSDGTWRWVLSILGMVLILSAVLNACGLNLLVGRPITANPRKKR